MLASALVRPVLAVPVLAHPMIDLAVVVPVLLDLYSPFLVPDYTSCRLVSRGNQATRVQGAVQLHGEDCQHNPSQCSNHDFWW